MIKELLRIGAQFVGYRDYASKTEEKLAEANERADTLALKLEQCEEARKKAESDAVEARQEADKVKADAAGVEDLRKRLHDAETSLSDHITTQSAREAAITKRIKTQIRRFVDRTSQEFELEDPDNDVLLDAVCFVAETLLSSELLCDYLPKFLKGDLTLLGVCLMQKLLLSSCSRMLYGGTLCIDFSQGW
nr:uncharacterized protein LOC127303317 [Lolium perenne]